MAQLIMRRTKFTEAAAWNKAITETTQELKQRGFMGQRSGGSESYTWKVSSRFTAIAGTLLMIERIHDVELLIDSDYELSTI